MLVFGCGSNRAGQLGPLPAAAEAANAVVWLPQLLPALAGLEVEALGCGAHATCVLTAGGAVHRLLPANRQLAVGGGFRRPAAAAAPKAAAALPLAPPLPGLAEVVGVCAGGSHWAFCTAGGLAYTCGLNRWGQLGAPPAPPGASPAATVTDRQTDTHTETQAHRQTGTQTHRHTDTQTDRQTHTQTDLQPPIVALPHAGMRQLECSVQQLASEHPAAVNCRRASGPLLRTGDTAVLIASGDTAVLIASGDTAVLML